MDVEHEDRQGSSMQGRRSPPGSAEAVAAVRHAPHSAAPAASSMRRTRQLRKPAGQMSCKKWSRCAAAGALHRVTLQAQDACGRSNSTLVVVVYSWSSQHKSGASAAPMCSMSRCTRVAVPLPCLLPVGAAACQLMFQAVLQPRNEHAKQGGFAVTSGSSADQGTYFPRGFECFIEHCHL